MVTCIYITKNPAEVYDYLSKNNIDIVKKGKNYIEWRENNETWIWRPINDSVRGYRFYKVKISKNYNDIEKLKNLIVPYCSLYCGSWEVM